MNLDTEGVTLGDFLHEVESFSDFAEARVVAVEVRGVLPVVHDEELRASGVPSGVGHAQHPFVVVLVVPVQLAVDGVPGSAASDALGTSALRHKAGNHTVKLQALIEAFFGELHEVGHSLGRVLFEELHGHGAVVGVNRCSHGAKMHHCLESRDAEVTNEKSPPKWEAFCLEVFSFRV